MGYPATYRTREFRAVARSGFQNAAPVLRYLLNNAANSNTIIRAYGGINFLQMARIAKQTQPFGKRAVVSAIAKRSAWAAVKGLPRIASRLSPWARAALIAVELAELYKRVLNTEQHLARGNTLQHSCGGGTILSNTRTAPNCGLSLLKVLPFPNPLGWPNPIQWGWWTVEGTAPGLPPSVYATNWQVWSRTPGLPLNPLQQQPAPRFQGRKHYYALPQDQPVRGSQPFYAPEWAPGDLPDIAPPMINPQSIPIGVQMPTPAPVPYWLIPHWKPNPWHSPTEQTQKGNDFDEISPSPKPRPRPRPRPRPGPGTGTVPGTGVQISPSGSEFTSVQWDAPNSQPRANAPPHRYEPPDKGTKEIKGRSNSKFLTALNWVNEFTEWTDYISALWGTLDKKYRTKSKLLQDKAKDLYRHYDKLDLETAVKALVRNEIEDFLYGTIGQFSAKVANRRGERMRGLRIDTAGRTMRKLDTGVRDVVDGLVDRIMNEVFNEEGK